MERIPTGETKVEIKKNKAEGYLHTIDTLRSMNAEGSRRYAVLSFCDLILNELENLKKGEADLNAIRNRINNLREEVKKDNNYDGDNELTEIVEEVKSLVK